MKGLEAKAASQNQEMSSLKGENKDMDGETIKLRNDLEEKVRKMKELNAEVKENKLKVRKMRADMVKMGKDTQPQHIDIAGVVDIKPHAEKDLK